VNLSIGGSIQAPCRSRSTDLRRRGRHTDRPETIRQRPCAVAISGSQWLSPYSKQASAAYIRIRH